MCGGVQVSDPRASLVMHLAHELSANGRCATFDATADGFARAEGCGALWLTLTPTQKEMSHIIASVPGVDVQHAGRSVALTSPSGKAQQAVLRGALGDSGLSEEDISSVECHGTGTALGDPMEVAALRDVMYRSKRTTPLILGTVKTNVAHTESASGVVGLIKCILHMSRRCVPPNLHLRQLNHHLDGAANTTTPSKLQYPIESSPLVQRSHPTIAGIVTAFGLGGCNAAAVFQPRITSVNPRQPDSKHKGLHAETWV